MFSFPASSSGGRLIRFLKLGVAVMTKAFPRYGGIPITYHSDEDVRLSGSDQSQHFPGRHNFYTSDFTCSFQM
jgi:hypothetical protein